VCEEHCPVPQKAIKISEIAVNGRTVGRPVIDERLCIGCGICQNKCPVRPVRAVRVYPAGAERM
jgi:translation initiation factor RLI1